MTSSSDTVSSPTSETTEGYGSKGYRTYVLIALIVVYTFNFIDRTLIGVLGEPCLLYTSPSPRD